MALGPRGSVAGVTLLIPLIANRDWLSSNQWLQLCELLFWHNHSVFIKSNHNDRLRKTFTRPVLTVKALCNGAFYGFQFSGRSVNLPSMSNDDS